MKSTKKERIIEGRYTFCTEQSAVKADSTLERFSLEEDEKQHLHIADVSARTDNVGEKFDLPLLSSSENSFELYTVAVEVANAFLAKFDDNGREYAEEAIFHNSSIIPLKIVMNSLVGFDDNIVYSFEAEDSAEKEITMTLSTRESLTEFKFTFLKDQKQVIIEESWKEQ